LAHAADIHLDTDHQDGGHNLAQRDYCRAVFRRLLDRIEADGPDLMLLPGDLFDSNRASADTVAWAAEQLAALPFPVVLIPGNHDCLEVGTVYGRMGWERIQGLAFLGAPEGERRLLAELGVAVWGRGMVSHHPGFEPLAGIPAPLPGYWNLGLGHGIFAGEAGPSYRSSPIRSRQIAASGYDYIALGHHHMRLDVSQPGTNAWFSGSPIPVTPERKGTYLTIALEPGRPAQVTLHELE
jgi:DNA repair exonuclease SbcCD nuclease subunit